MIDTWSPPSWSGSWQFRGAGRPVTQDSGTRCYSRKSGDCQNIWKGRLLVSWGCHNKVLWAGWLKQPQIFIVFTFLEARSPRLRRWWEWFLLRTACKDLFHVSLLVSGGLLAIFAISCLADALLWSLLHFCMAFPSCVWLSMSKFPLFIWTQSYWIRLLLFSLSCVWLFATSWTVVRQASLSMGFSRSEYWSGLPFSSPGDLPNPGVEPTSLVLANGFFTTEPPRKPSDWGSP